MLTSLDTQKLFAEAAAAAAVSPRRHAVGAGRSNEYVKPLVGRRAR